MNASRLPKHSRRDRALKLRDTALKPVQTKGKLSPLLTGKTVLFKTLTYHSGHLQIQYRSPYTPVPDGAAIMPYGLDVYWPEKVLVIEWNDAGEVVFEIVSLAVILERRGEGIGRQLVEEAVTYCRLNNAVRLVVCTGSWETDNIIFYLRRGFRIFNVARDYFTSQRGYTQTVRDQVQFEMLL